ncbi:piggyBac transposable element-derived protein 4-like [Leptidea sinapis]|uniref:piggyBac transposable element-derived protein 4-like n=1 Tax=Leptidea sinapis TaxID=189913 RepID=UPI0021C2EE63|nr:piggyBac transposable element-derived protein 4-like [Leptidea sinapis]
MEAHVPNKLFEFDWQAIPGDHIYPQLRREHFVGASGPMIGSSASPYASFVSIWDRPIMEHIAKETNRYAQEYATHLINRGKMRPSNRITLWTETDVDELYVYFALVTAMGIVLKTRIEDYWTTDMTIFSTPGFSISMPIKRFQLLSRYLHFIDNSQFSTNISHSQAKIFKLQPIVQHLNLKFSTLYSLSQNIALDENLTQWKGWLDFKQFIPTKASAVGIKSYELCDSRTGYLWRFEVHAGGESETNQELISGSIPNLVLRLLRGLEHRGHTVWMDSYYNSPVLARVLKTLGFDCVGTLRTNRQFVPDLIRNLKSSDMRKGQVCGCTSGDVNLMVWRDQNHVAMISTYHGVGVSDNKPILIKDFSVCMEGVDKKDQTVSMYPMERKRTMIWYKQFFRRLLNVSIWNSYIIHKHFTPTIEHRAFRMELVTQILQHHLRRTELSLVTMRGVPKFSDEVLSHFPTFLPLFPTGTKGSRQKRRCYRCKILTHFVCRACNVALCFNTQASCFILHHS